MPLSRMRLPDFERVAIEAGEDGAGEFSESASKSGGRPQCRSCLTLRPELPQGTGQWEEHDSERSTVDRALDKSKWYT